MKNSKNIMVAIQSFLGLLLLVVIFTLPYSGTNLSSIIPFLCISCLSAVQILKTIMFGWQRLHEQVFWVFNFVWLGLAPLVQQLSGIRPLPFDVNEADYSRAGWLVLFSLISYSIVVEIKFITPKNQLTKKRIRSFNKLIRACNLSSLLTLTIVFFIGPEVFLQSRESLNKALFTQSRADNSQGAILAALCCVPIFVCMIALQIQLNQNTESDFRRKLQRNFRFIVILNIFVNNPISQGRFWFCTVWGSFLLVKYWGQSKKISYFPTIGIAFILLIFPVSDVFRYSNSDSKFEVKSPTLMLETKGDFDSFEQIAWGIKFVDDSGYMKGNQLLGAVAFAIPRAIWPDKPRDTGIILGKAANFGNLSLSAPIWIEGYIDGGLVMMSFYMILIAYVHARFRKQNEKRNEFAIIFILYQLVVLRGSLIASMGITAVLLVSIYFLREFGEAKIES